MGDGSDVGIDQPGDGRGRDETVNARDEASEQRDELAEGRDRKARQRGLECGDVASAWSQVQALQARSLADQQSPAEYRATAREERESAEPDHEEARRDRERARGDTRSLARAQRTIRDLSHERAHLIGALSVGHFGTWEWDIASDVTTWTAELYRIYGRKPSDEAMTFDQYIAFVHEDDRAAVRKLVAKAFETGEPFSFEHRITRPDGAVRILHARGGVVLGTDGVPLTMRGTAQDITERLEIERAKDEFISIVSHELRTPLSSIRGSLGLLASGAVGPLPEQGQRMIEIAVENTDRLVRLINDILDIERIDAGTIDMHPQPCDGAELIATAIRSLEQVAAEARVTLTGQGAPMPLSADPDRIHQALTNLIGNAIKFSRPDSTVRVSCTPRESDVLFAVADDGRGIPDDRLEAIFERFGQVDVSDSREKGGTGLGLAICRMIVERHGGRIWVDSQLGVGSTFAFALPVRQPSSSGCQVVEVPR